MNPSPGRQLHVNVPNLGWRPMTVTTVKGVINKPGEHAVSGWVLLDPDDDPLVAPNWPLLRVINAFEGVDEGNWRWPPRVS